MQTKEFLAYLRTIPKHKLQAAIESLPEHVATALLHDLNGAQEYKRSYATPGDLAKALDKKTIQTPALDIIDTHLVECYDTTGGRLTIAMPPQEGKSTRASEWFPLWVLSQNPDTRIIIVSATSALATKFSMRIRQYIKEHGAELGLKLSDEHAKKDDWKLDGHEGGVRGVGLTGTLSGYPADLIIIDDPLKNMAEAQSVTQREKIWDMWTTTIAARLADGTSVVVIQTRWHDDDLTGKLLKDNPDEWVELRIPAQADHKPELGETDPLGRTPGEYMISARGRTSESWEKRKREAGPKTWAALYQGVPSPDEGGIFPGDWARYDKPLWTVQADGSRLVPGIGRADHELIQSWDLAFKGGQTSDFVVGQVWLRVGSQAYLLDMVRARMNFTETLDAIKALSARWPQAYAKYVEDKANGPAVMQALTGQLGGLIPVTPEGGKEARANAVSAFAFSGDIILPDPVLLPNVGELVEELKLFPASSHDDAVDALTQAVSQLLLYRIDDGVGESLEMFEDYEITPY